MFDNTAEQTALHILTGTEEELDQCNMSSHANGERFHISTGIYEKKINV
jgi:hypothetical protein